MLTIDDLSVRIAGRLLLDDASAQIPAGARVGLVGRNGTGKSTLFRVITGELAAEHGGIALAGARHASAVCRRRRRTAPSSLIDDRARRRPRAHARSSPRPSPRAIRIASPRCRRASPTSAPTRRRRARPRSLPGSASRTTDHRAALRGVFRRLAHARGAGGGAVRAARSPAARRADQLSRPRRHALARGSHRPLSAHRDRDQPRPRSPRQRGRLDPASRRRQAHLLSRRLLVVRAPARASARRSISSSPRSRRRSAST